MESNLTLIVGSMSAGKSDLLIGHLDSAEDEGKRVVAIRPALDTRTDGLVIRSRSGKERAAIVVNSASESLKHLEPERGNAVLGIDEAHMFTGDDIKSTISCALAFGCQVYVAGLIFDWKHEYFSHIKDLMGSANYLVMLYAPCSLCRKAGLFNATSTQYPAQERIEPGFHYEARCTDCKRKASK